MNHLARCLFLIVAASPAVAPAHEGHDHAPAEAKAPQFPAAMLLPAIEGPKPWTDKPLLDDPDRFQIAIMTDRTGGHRPGVWLDAVRKLNLLRPEFVVSVGDLIEGYTEDSERLEAEWKEFLGFIDELQMRFFFVAGNHDVTNPKMHKLWREKFGRAWYSFDYRGVHFLCLCSEDPVNQLGEEQLGFIEKDLADNADARWTLVFLHKPLWTYAERQLENDGEDRTNWKRVEAMLVDRPHTVFSGHVHHYVQYERNGREYYSLATTGGGSRLRGNDYGEFDHVTWLTMEPDGPHVVNLRLDGILPAGVVTEQSAERFSEFLRKATVRVAPILIDGDGGFDEGDLSVQLVNELGRNVEITGRLDGLPLRGLTVAPEELRLSVGPTGTSEQTVRIRFAEQLPFDSLRRATFTAKVRAEGLDGEPEMTAERVIPVVIDRRYECPVAPEPLEIDGDLDAWPERTYSTPDTPIVAGATQEWQGPADGAFSLATSHDEERLYVQVRVTDERVLAGDDFMTLAIDARPANVRRDFPRLRGGTYVVSVPAPEESQPGGVEVGAGWRALDQPIEGVTAAARQTEAGYDIEVAVPLKILNRHQNGDWKGFQMSAVMTDVDDPQRPAAEIVWRGSRDYRVRNTGFAHFTRGE